MNALVSPSIIGLGTPLGTLDVNARPNFGSSVQVKKTGRTTGTTYGRISGRASLLVNYPQVGQTAYVRNQIQMTGLPSSPTTQPFFAQPGDSGAIVDDGQVILGADELLVATQAIQKLGPGIFALRRIGADAEIRWRRGG